MNILRKTYIIIFVFFYIFFSQVSSIKAEIFDFWQETTSLEYPISGHTSLNFNDNIYTINGSNLIGTTHPDTWESNSTVDGQLTQWQSISQLNQPLIGLKATSNANYGYLAGGLIDQYIGYTTVNTVSIAKFVNGQLEPWSATQAPLTQQLTQGGFISINNRLYYVGGYEIHGFGSSEIPHNEVVFSNLNDEGSIVGWQNTTPLNTSNNQAIYSIGISETGKKILTIGGKKNQNERFSRSVFQADVNPITGELGPWIETFPLPDNNGLYIGYNGVGAIRVGNYIIVVGGNVPPTTPGVRRQSNKVYFTTINADGSINDWQTSQYNLPIPSGDGGVQYANGYLYYIGGYGGDFNTYHNKVFFTKLNIEEPEKAAIIVVPGLGGSWNADALLNCRDNDEKWVLSPFAEDVYNSLLAVLNQSGHNVMPFYYDWRKNVRDHTNNLKNLIDSQNGKSYLVGHSMGGLLARAYLNETEYENKLNKLITVGTPHKGSVLAYPTWSAGTVWDDNYYCDQKMRIPIKKR